MISHDEPYIAPSSLGVIIRSKHGYYLPGWYGYTALIGEAGRYDRAVAKRHAEKTEGVTIHELSEFWRRTDQEVMELLRSDTPLNRARREFSTASARIEQANQQQKPFGPIEMRRMEFEAVERIAAALGEKNERP
jgi:hypothetical protein